MLKGRKIIPDIITAIMLSEVAYYPSGNKAWTLTEGSANEWEFFVENNDEAKKSATLLGFKPVEWQSSDFDKQVTSIWQVSTSGDCPARVVLLFVNDAEQRQEILRALIRTNPNGFESRQDEAKAYNLGYAVLENFKRRGI